jgi:hypothetical protein
MMADLLDGLSRLAATSLPPDSRLALSGVMRHARDLEAHLVGAGAQTGGLAQTIDRGTFDNLMLLAGPGVATELLQQLSADLSQVLVNLRKALPRTDWEAIRSQTHILMALTGSIGAMRGHSMALELNQAAHDEDRAITRLTAANVMGEIETLIVFITAERQRYPGDDLPGEI